MYFLWKAFNLFGNLICVNHRAVFDANDWPQLPPEGPWMVYELRFE